MPLENQSRYPTEQVEELARFVMGERFDIIAQRGTVVVTDDPETMMAGGAGGSPDNPFQHLTVTVGTEKPRHLTGIKMAALQLRVPLRDWRDRLVHNLASVSMATATLHAQTADDAQQAILQQQDGILEAMRRYWEAEEAGQFSWQQGDT